MDDSHYLAVTSSPDKPALADGSAGACMTYEELSERTGLSLSTLRRRVKDGCIPFIQPGGTRTRIVFPIDVIDRLTQGVAPSAKATPEPIQLKVRQYGPRPKWQKGPQS